MTESERVDYVFDRLRVESRSVREGRTKCVSDTMSPARSLAKCGDLCGWHLSKKDVLIKANAIQNIAKGVGLLATLTIHDGAVLTRDSEELHGFSQLIHVLWFECRNRATERCTQSAISRLARDDQAPRPHSRDQVNVHGLGLGQSEVPRSAQAMSNPGINSHHLRDGLVRLLFTAMHWKSEGSQKALGNGVTLRRRLGQPVHPQFKLADVDGRLQDHGAKLSLRIHVTCACGLLQEELRCLRIGD